MHVCVCACVRASALCRRCGGTAGAGDIYCSTGGTGRPQLARLRFDAIGRASRASAAGATWTSRTTNAPWAARRHHASVIDAAGAIYVIGGDGGLGDTNFQDVWVSTDGGARPDSVKEWWSGEYTVWLLREY